MLPSIEHRLAAGIAAKPAQVAAAIALLDEGATVPFISRYRKEATGGLDDTQLRLLEDRLRYLRELEARRAAIIESITEQNKMTPELLKEISLAPDKTQLEDLYLPYKPKRRTRARVALEAGLEPLADALLANPLLNPDAEAARYLRDPFTTEQGDNPGAADAKAALDGARQILMERFAEDAVLLQWINILDTANSYTSGWSEVLLGKAIQGRRRDVIVATKFFNPTGPGPNDSGMSRVHITQAIEDSLRRLDTDYVDIYYVHHVDVQSSLEEMLSTLDEQVDQGKVRYIACSNYEAWRNDSNKVHIKFF